MASVKGNIVLNGINTATGIIFPVITFPYAARVLLPEGIGAVNFLNSIVSYIVLLTSLGIPMYAVKEIAKYRDEKDKRDKITVEILILSTILCLLGYVAVWVLAKLVPQIHEQSALFYILSLTIIFTGIGVNWFYQGIEDFKFITIRAIIIRTLAAASLFLFVKNSSDLLIYGLIIVGSTVGNNILNFIHLRKYVNPFAINWQKINVLKHIKPSIQVFILNLIISLYIQLNSIMLGFLSGDEAVGYFTAGTKISHIGLTIISSLGAVLLPHCSNLLKKGDIPGFNAVIKKSLNLTLALALPMTVGLMILATPITILFCGEEFMDSIPVLYLNAPVIIFISLTNLMGIQILYPMDKINIVILSVTGAAIGNLILNIFLIPAYAANGAAIATLIAEFTALVVQLALGHKYYPFTICNLANWKYIIGSLLMGLVVYISVLPLETDLSKLTVGILMGVLAYAIFLYLCKDQILSEFFNFIFSKTTKKNT